MKKIDKKFKKPQVGSFEEALDVFVKNFVTDLKKLTHFKVIKLDKSKILKLNKKKTKK